MLSCMHSTPTSKQWSAAASPAGTWNLNMAEATLSSAGSADRPHQTQPLSTPLCLCSLSSASIRSSSLNYGKKKRSDCGAGEEEQGMRGRDLHWLLLISALLGSFSFCSHKRVAPYWFFQRLPLVFILTYLCIAVPTFSNQLPETTSLEYPGVIWKCPASQARVV